MSYGATVVDAVHQAGIYAGKILSGAKAADLPVIEPTRFEFVTNLEKLPARLSDPFCRRGDRIGVQFVALRESGSGTSRRFAVPHRLGRCWRHSGHD
jgi:hypothetical protein